jgi:hypothetical protein
MSFVFRTPEVDSLGGRSPLDKLRRHTLWEMAREKGLVPAEEYPTKEELIPLIESAPEQETLISIERAKSMKTFALRAYVSKRGVPVANTSTREYLLGEYEKILEAA